MISTTLILVGLLIFVFVKCDLLLWLKLKLHGNRINPRGNHPEAINLSTNIAPSQITLLPEPSPNGAQEITIFSHPGVSTIAQI